MNIRRKIFIPLTLIILLGIELLISNRYLQIGRFKVVGLSKDEGAIRIVQLSDLHNASFGYKNKRLISKVLAEEPDLIFMTGDMINGDEEELTIITELIGDLKDIAPVYYSYGNHELDWIETFGTKKDLKKALTEAGTVVLENEYVDIDIDDVALRVGGTSGDCLPLQYKDLARVDNQQWVRSFQKTDRYSILLCHIPVSWIAYGGMESWKVDMVFCGHAHGGQIRIPFLGGLYVPDMGWLPGKVDGKFVSENGEATVIVSRGLGSETYIPRVNNISQILCVDLICADKSTLDAVMILTLFLSLKHIYIETWGNQGADYNGYFVNFGAQLVDLITNNKLKGYSIETVENIEKRYITSDETTGLKDERTPTIIAIMDESFSDLSIISENSDLDQVMPFFNSLNENIIKGYALSSVYGGGTANSEYEFLTGNTLGFLANGATVYQLYLNSQEYSIASYLKNRGYKTVATHPYLASGWSRTKAWPYLGFENITFIDCYPQKDLVRGLVL